MADQFEDAKLRCNRGKFHIKDLRQRILDFSETITYSSSVEYVDLEGIKEVHWTKLSKPLPTDLKTVAADAALNLRAALDLAVSAVLHSRINPRNAKFPFDEDSAAFERNGIFKNFPDDIKPLFRSFKPYEGGNNLLWALNRICNTDKHRMLNPLFVRARIIGSPDSASIARKDEIVVNIVDLDESPQHYSQLEFAVAFGEVDIVKGQPVVTVLGQLADIVDSIILTIEAEARRLGWLS
jgi:hypothetical protein